MSAKGFCICPLASGSKGNSVYISGGQTSILVDAGLSGIELERRMKARGVSPEELSAIVVTHEHTDHVQAAGVLSRRYHLPLYINEGTLKASAAKIGKVEKIEFFDCGNPFSIGDIEIYPFSTSHDACDPAGLVLDHHDVKFGIATDMGIVTQLVREHLKGCSLIYLEANHDPDMLMDGPYPWHLKQRIKGRRGHLSNYDTGELLAEIGSNSLSHVILAHLSQENNTPELALRTVSKAIDLKQVCIDVARPDMPGQVITFPHNS